MNKALKPFWLVLILAAGMIGFSLFNRASDGKERIPWRSDLGAAMTEAQSANKPLFLYFTADWCGPCQSLKNTTWADADVEQVLSNFIPVKIDIDAHPDLARQYPSEGIPHFVITKSDGTTIRDMVGALPPQDFIDWLTGKAM